MKYKDMYLQKKLLFSWLLILLIIAISYIFISNKKDYSEELNIISPQPGEVFSPSETINITVIPAENATFKRIVVSLYGSMGVLVKDNPPFEFTMTLPETLGPLILQVYGDKINGERIKKEIPLTTQVAPSFLLENIIISPPNLNFDSLSAYDSLFVQGDYSNGKRYDITDHQTGTTYLTKSGTYDVIKIEDDGQIIAIAEGQDVIIVSNSGITKEVPVVVYIANNFNR